MNTNIFNQIEKNATKDNYLNEIAVTQISPSNKIKKISYSALFRLSEKTSLALLELGIKKNDKVYISIKSSIEFIAVFLGCLKSGVIPIPGNPELSNDQTNHILNNSTPTLIITDTKINCKNLNFDHRYFSHMQWNKITNKVKPNDIKTCMSNINDVAFNIFFRNNRFTKSNYA